MEKYTIISTPKIISDFFRGGKLLLPYHGLLMVTVGVLFPLCLNWKDLGQDLFFLLLLVVGSSRLHERGPRLWPRGHDRLESKGLMRSYCGILLLLLLVSPAHDDDYREKGKASSHALDPP